jgi:hypothetical protein
MCPVDFVTHVPGLHPQGGSKDVKFDDMRRTNPKIPLRVLGALCGLAVKSLLLLAPRAAEGCDGLRRGA